MSKTSTTNTRTLLRSLAITAGGCALAAASQAATIIPDKGGWGGFVNLGVGGVTVKSNMLASIANGNIDIGHKTVNNLYNSPSSDDAFIPTVNFELSYTFEGSRTQLYLGNLLEDFLSFDMNTRAGIRQEVGDAGVVGLALLKTSLTTEVWEDPYATNVRRKDTDRTGDGYRVNWSQIMSSGLELVYSSQSIDIDNERSGQALDLSPGQRKELNRNGDIERLDANYEFVIEPKRHIFTPGVSYIDNNFDGGAMANDGWGISGNYIFVPDNTWRWVFNASYASLDFNRANPIYGKKDSEDRYGLSATVFYADPFGLKKWALNFTGAYYEADHDLDFYDSSAGLVSVGMFRKF